MKAIMESLKHWRQREPWTVDGYTYATDGAIIIRVPQFGHYSNNGLSMPPDDFPFSWDGMTEYKLVEPKEFVYEECDPCCDHNCDEDYRCHKKHSFLACLGVIQRGGHVLNQQLIYLFNKLKNTKVYFPDNPDGVGYFTFDGGDGHFMLMVHNAQTAPE